MYSNLVVSVLLAASALVKATPLVTRDDNYAAGFIAALKKAGASNLADKFSDYGQTSEGQRFIQSIQSDDKLTFFAPVDSGFYPDSIVDFSRYFPFSTIYGNVISSKRAPYNSHSTGDSKMQSADLRKRWGASQVQVYDTYYSDSSLKRWDGTTILVNKAVGAAKVLDESSYKNIQILTVDDTVTVPTKLDDLLCKALVPEAPYGFVNFGGGLQKTGQDDILFNSVRTTFLVPTDKAFEEAQVPDDKLHDVMQNHVIRRVVYTTGFLSTVEFEAESGKKITFELIGQDVYVSCGNSKVAMLRRDVPADNGVIHVLGGVLLCD